jgi:hypothetical protein
VVLASPVFNEAVDFGLQQSGVNVDASAVANTVRITAIAIAVILVAVYLLFAFKMRAGRNWARIVLTVFGALSILSAVTPGGGMTRGSFVIDGRVFQVTQAPTWAGAVLAVIGIVLMFLAPSNKYFTDHKAWQMRQYR